MKPDEVITEHQQHYWYYFSGLTCIQNFDDGRGLLNVQGDIIKPGILHQEHEDIQTIVQGTVGLCLKSAGLIGVIFGPEPVSRGGPERSRKGMVGVGMHGLQKLENI